MLVVSLTFIYNTINKNRTINNYLNYFYQMGNVHKDS
jgi:hypothetical protein